MRQTEALKADAEDWSWAPAKTATARPLTGDPSLYPLQGGTISHWLPSAVTQNKWEEATRLPLDLQPVAPAQAEHLDAVVVRIEDEYAYVSTGVGQSATTLRMSVDLFPEQSLRDGSPVRIGLGDPTSSQRIVVTARGLEPQPDAEAQELMDWVNAL